MSKIYVFGIGGTGSRVLRALTMLLATGVECAADTIVPIIIDPDAAAGDVERTVSLMRQYSQIRSKLNFDTTTKNRFFKTNIMESMDSFRLPLSNTQNVTFKDYMGVNEMSIENKALVNMLFSHDNLNSNMKVGFKGNPNIGSVVLNQFDESEQFRNFANEFTENDKIFIISSIFGGTGASGFPLLLKTLRTNEKIANKDWVNKSFIGAITVLPYFQVKQDDSSKIDSTTFVSKARSALAYYERNISRNNEIDMLYYIADDVRKTYENIEGGTEQKNNAHFVELAAAMALVDFANSTKPKPSIHKEFGIENDTNEIIFDDLGYLLKSQIRKPMTQFNLFSKYFLENSDLSFLTQPWAKDRNIDRTFFNSDFINTLKSVQKAYIEWLKEMENQDRKFTPFNIHNDSDRVFDFVKGVTPKRLFLKISSNYKLIDEKLNEEKVVQNVKPEQQLMDIFYQSTQNLLKLKLNIE